MVAFYEDTEDQALSVHGRVHAAHVRHRWAVRLFPRVPNLDCSRGSVPHPAISRVPVFMSGVHEKRHVDEMLWGRFASFIYTVGIDIQCLVIPVVSVLVELLSHHWPLRFVYDYLLGFPVNRGSMGAKTVRATGWLLTKLAHIFPMHEPNFPWFDVMYHLVAAVALSVSGAN